MKKKSIYAIILVAILLCIISIVYCNNSILDLRTIKSNKQLLRIYNGNSSTAKEILVNIVTMPFSVLQGSWWYYDYGYGYDYVINDSIAIGGVMKEESITNSTSSSSSQVAASAKDYSTTNIQVENVDEADITKTDGDYIYSISEDNVIITNVMDPENIKIETTIKSTSNSVPEDLILYKNKLIVISANLNSTNSYYNANNNTIVKIYDITDKANPVLLKDYELYEPYYTSRCIDNQLYVISAGNLREEDDKIITYYKENNIKREIELDNIKYLKDVKTRKQTLISSLNLDNPKQDVKISSYLMDISNAYVSENSIYLLNEKYDYTGAPPISTLFGLKGAIGPFVYEDSELDGYHTEIYKFNISQDGYVTYDCKTKIKGSTINQYSLDELNGHLRVALYDEDGSRIVIFDENLKQIGKSEYVAKGETMYSSRFIDNKVYFVTYKTMDPLFVIDLSDETKPKVLGELKIPGYSTYLHPYDENHLIGIGMETEEVVNRNASGRVTSTTSRIIGMKMALFDVSDVNNPKQISSVVIGDRRATSAILTNPKALLFSKEKELIAIPVNNYSEDFAVNNSSDTYSSIINSYSNYSKSYISEGYFVYNINIEDGFNLNGVITHEKAKQSSSYYNYRNSKLLRGLYIDNNLYTVSETAVKVNNLETLELIDEIEIK